MLDEVFSGEVPDECKREFCNADDAVPEAEYRDPNCVKPPEGSTDFGNYPGCLPCWHKDWKAEKCPPDVLTQVIIVCYFALTTLSTVGYGDYYPISNLEKLSAVVIMLGGVAFFSFIMGNFIDIISNYDKKMGSPDRMPLLNTWIISLERFNGGTPLRMS